MSFKIGNLEVKSKVLLAPMAGVTNEAFFYVAKKYGAGLLYSEMVSDKGICFNNQKTLNLLKFDQSLHPFVIQLFGNDPKDLVPAAKVAEEIGHPDVIDINMGCSVPKIFKNGSGSALLKDPNKVYEIVKSLVDNINTPITIKIRSGIGHDSINYLEIGKMAEKAGASAIAIHPRTKTDLFKNKANWEHIKLLKESLSIPVIGNGDIKTPEDAKRMLDETGCDAVMIGRAAMGNPFIFKQINEYLETGSYSQITNEEKFDTMIEHFDYLMESKGEKIAVLEMRTHAAWYVKGMRDSIYFKSKLNEVQTKEEFLGLVDELKARILDKN